MSAVFYFAYGSNMSARRISKRVPSAIKVGRARLDGYKLVFHKVSKDGSGKCDAIATAGEGDCVHGVIYTVNQNEMAQLDAFEGVKSGYDRKTIQVLLPTGEKVSAACYFATRVNGSLKPYTWYLEHVLYGAREALLPAEYIAGIAGTLAEQDHDKERRAKELSIYEQAS